MKNGRLKLILMVLLLMPMVSSTAQKNPDKFINYLKKSDSAVALTLPGWVIKLTGKLASSDIDDDEAAMIRELTGHIRKIRFVVNESVPDDYNERLARLKSKLLSDGYESLIEVRDNGSDVNLLASFDGNTIKKLVISVLEDDNTVVFFNIKSNIDMDRLKQMQFYREWKKEEI